MAASKSQDTEITLDVGKMLVLFFGLVALCGVFFGLGFSVGKKSATSNSPDASQQGSVVAGGVRPSAVKAPDNSASNLSFYKGVVDKNPNSQLTPAAAVTAPDAAPPADAKPAQPDPAVASPTTGYFVQVAAVTKQEDADSLVDALKKKQYPALIASATDKLFHVQVGPYPDIKDAEAMRGKLVSDGYNPILKK
jgi:cell division septation protein DedD